VNRVDVGADPGQNLRGSEKGQRETAERFGEDSAKEEVHPPVNGDPTAPSGGRPAILEEIQRLAGLKGLTRIRPELAKLISDQTIPPAGGGSMYLGAHMSIAESVALAPERGEAVGCEAIQIFSRSPRMLRNTKPLSVEETTSFRDNLAAHRIARAVIHANYLINLASPSKHMLKVSRTAFVEELDRAQQLGVRDVIFHPGAHMGKGEAAGLRTIAQSLDWCLEHAQAPDVFAVLENTAGAGSVLGSTFEQIGKIIHSSSHPDRLGLCVDTCHTFAAGYDFRTREGYDSLTGAIDATVGLARLRAFHLNDSKGDLGSHRDLHENIGKGKIGLEGFRPFVNDARFREHPGCLEFPGDDTGYRRNLKALRSLIEGYVPPKRARRSGT
jgi:deoxyribonuclease-4